MTVRIVMIVAMFLAGCAAQLAGERQGVSNQPVEYQDGYEDGCSSGYVAAGHPYFAFKKDLQRMQFDQLYGQGWGDGMLVCKGKYESIQRSLK